MKARWAVAAVAVAAGAEAAAATWSVGPTRLHRELSELAPRLRPGDVVEIDAGSRLGPVRLTRSGEAGRPIVIRGTEGGTRRPVIDAAGAADALRMDVDHYVIEDVVVTGASQRCVFLHGHGLALRRVAVRDCAAHGILGADDDTGDVTLTEVEVSGSGAPQGPGNLKHPIYVATDLTRYPFSRFRIERSWVHDNRHGNSVKSRARRTEVLYNWLEADGEQRQVLELVGPEKRDCPVPDGRNTERLCGAEVVGNVLIARGRHPNLVRIGGDTTGAGSRGRYRFLHNTFVAGDAFPPGATLVRAHTQLDAVEFHNNIFWIRRAAEGPFRLLADADAKWVAGRKVAGSRNLVTGSQAAYRAAGMLPPEWKETLFVAPDTPVFAHVDLADPARLDLRLHPQSPARNAGAAAPAPAAGFEADPPYAARAESQPPRMRPDPGDFHATPRPLPDGRGAATSPGAYE